METKFEAWTSISRRFHLGSLRATTHLCATSKQRPRTDSTTGAAWLKQGKWREQELVSPTLEVICTDENDGLSIQARQLAFESRELSMLATGEHRRCGDDSGTPRLEERKQFCCFVKRCEFDLLSADSRWSCVQGRAAPSPAFKARSPTREP